MNNILVSIIIPVYKDWIRLSTCINALSVQTFARDKFEVIIVNNNPNDTTPEDLLLPYNVTIITEAKPGSYAARNTALKIACGDIVGFTDSDCIPDSNWIKYAVDYFNANPACSRIAGKVAIFCKSKSSRIEIYDTLFAFNQKGYVNGSGTSVTANLFTYKNIFDKIGYFDENLMSGGDFFWGTIANKEGYRIDYVEEVMVKHPARDTLHELVKKEKRVGGSQAKFIRSSGNSVVKILKFVKALKPRAGDIKLIVSKKNKLTTFNKIYILLVRQYLLSIRAYARLRVQMGKKTNRA